MRYVIAVGVCALCYRCFSIALYALPVFISSLARMYITDSQEKKYFLQNSLPRKNFATED